MKTCPMKSHRCGSLRPNRTAMIHSAAAASDTRAAVSVMGGMVSSAIFVNAYGIPHRIPSSKSRPNSSGATALLFGCTDGPPPVLALQYRCVDQRGAERRGIHRLVQKIVAVKAALARRRARIARNQQGGNLERAAQALDGINASRPF